MHKNNHLEYENHVHVIEIFFYTLSPFPDRKTCISQHSNPMQVLWVYLIQQKNLIFDKILPVV